MTTNEALKEIQNFSNKKFAISNGSKVNFLDGKTMNKNIMIGHKVPDAGTYVLSECTCGNKKCFIGKPKKGCHGFSELKCGVYSFNSLDILSLKISTIINILKKEK